MESYIVRIYRCEEKRPDRIVGMVEEPETKEKKPFKTLEDLGSILTENHSGSARKKRKSSAKTNNI